MRLPSSGSVDDQTVASFQWIQVEGPTVTLSDPHAEAPVFAPQQQGIYKFELVVTDNTGLESRSQTATFSVGNDPPEIRILAPGTGMVGGQVAVQFTLADSTADLANVQFEFSVDGGGTFLSATLIDEAPPVLIGRQSGTTGSVAVEGMTHTFVWNTTQDLGTTSPVDVFIRLTPAGSESGAASGPFTPNPPKDTDGRREDSGRGWVRELQGRWPGVLG